MGKPLSRLKSPLSWPFLLVNASVFEKGSNLPLHR
jgi:hypothetical protein